MLAAALILAVTCVGVAFIRLSRVNIDRPSAAFTGAILMVLFGVLTFEEAVRDIDFNTLGLLLGMMIVVASIKVTGLLDLLATKSLSLVVVEGADREGVRIGFLELLKLGALVTCLTVGLEILILTVEHWAGWLN